MKPLQTLHASLSAADEQVRDSEALLGAFGIELEELVDEVRVAKENSQLSPPKSAEEHADEHLENKLMETLKNLKDVRPGDIPPLVLLHRNDILDELSTLMARVQDMQQHEEAWEKDLPSALSMLSSAHAPLLSKIYENSAVNTSPPFAFPEEVARLQDEVKRKGDDLGENIERLQKELESLMANSRTKRKLGAFTDKWCKAGR